MAYSSWKDGTLTFNSVPLTAFVMGAPSGLAYHAKKQDFHPMGAVFPTPQDTGLRQQDDIVVPFMADGAAAGPNVTCTMGTSATLTLVLNTGQSISGTFWVSDLEYGKSPDGNDTLNVTFTPTGTITWDLQT